MSLEHSKFSHIENLKPIVYFYYKVGSDGSGSTDSSEEVIKYKIINNIFYSGSKQDEHYYQIIRSNDLVIFIKKNEEVPLYTNEYYKTNIYQNKLYIGLIDKNIRPYCVTKDIIDSIEYKLEINLNAGYFEHKKFIVKNPAFYVEFSVQEYKLETENKIGLYGPIITWLK